MAQPDLSRSLHSFRPRKRPKNREVENEMMGWVACPGEPPHNATEPITKHQTAEKAEDLTEPVGAGDRKAE